MNNKNFSLLAHLIVVGLLTLVAQIGGMIYLLSLIVSSRFGLSKVSTLLTFTLLYLLSTFILIPFFAPLMGRTALPLSGNLRPLNITTCLLNRHYVQADLKKQLEATADKMSAMFPGTSTNYLDANFPFLNGFPLFPHLSHNDGAKVDLAFYYKKDNNPVNNAPSFIGYGVYDDPKQGEIDYPGVCRGKGYWQYGLLSTIVPQWNKNDFQVDTDRTRALLKLLANSEKTSKIFIEPHLKERWQLNQLDKIRFHGCQAVRHDDHIHIQIN